MARGEEGCGYARLSEMWLYSTYSTRQADRAVTWRGSALHRLFEGCKASCVMVVFGGLVAVLSVA